MIVFGLMPIVAGLCYYMGTRKTGTPILNAFIGVLLCFLPPLALIYIAAMSLLKDINNQNSNETVN